MNNEETASLLKDMQQVGVPVNTAPATVQVWQRALSKFPAALVADEVQNFLVKEETAPRPSTIRKKCEARWEVHLREQARRLITNDPTKISFVEFKKRNPGRALAAYQEGYRQTHGCDDPSPPEWTRDDSSASILKSMSF